MGVFEWKGTVGLRALMVMVSLVKLCITILYLFKITQICVHASSRNHMVQSLLIVPLRVKLKINSNIHLVFLIRTIFLHCIIWFILSKSPKSDTLKSLCSFCNCKMLLYKWSMSSTSSNIFNASTYLYVKNHQNFKKEKALNV